MQPHWTGWPETGQDPSLTGARRTDTEHSSPRSGGERTLSRARRGRLLEDVRSAGPAGLAQDLLGSIFKVATELVRGERASLLLRDDATTDFVIARAVGIADEIQRHVRIREGEGVVGSVALSKRSLLVRNGDTSPAREGSQPGRYRTTSF